MHRRTFLAGTGCMLGLPALESLGQDSGAGNQAKAKRILFFCLGGGLYTPTMYADTEGRDFDMPEALKPMARHRKEITMIGGLRHLGNVRHHGGAKYGLACAADGNLKDSLDIAIAKHVGRHTRVAGVTTGFGSFENALPVAGSRSPRSFFNTLFGKIDKQQEAKMIKYQNSLLDYVYEDAGRLQKRVSAADKVKLEEYFASVRQAQKSLEKKSLWLQRPQVEVSYPRIEAQTADSPYEQKMASMAKQPSSARLVEELEMVKIAFKHDITRVANVSFSSPNYGYHGMTHGMGDGKGLTAWTTYYMEVFARLFDDMKAIKMPGGNSLFDETIFVAHSTLGMNPEIGSHSSVDTPLFIAGGRMDHGAYRNMKRQIPPANVYVGLMQHMGLPVDKFANNTGIFHV